MANEQKINEFIDFSALETEKQKAINEFKALFAEIKSVAEKGKVSFTGDAKSITEGTKAIQENEKAAKKQKETIDKTTEAYIKKKQITDELNRQKKLEVQATNDQIGAYKRLEAEAAMAQKRAKDLGAEFGKDSEQFKQAAAAADKLTTELKDIDSAMSLNQRNVGNYEGAVTSLRQEMKNLTQTLATMEMQGKGNTKEYDDMVRKLGQLKDAVGDVQARSKFWADDARYLNTAVQAVQGLVGAYSVYVGVTEIVGEKNEELEKIMRKMMALMTVMQGLQQVANMLNKDSYVRVAANVAIEKVRAYWTGVQTAATKADTVATEANTVAKTASKGIIGIIIVAVAALAYGIYKMIKFNVEAEIQQRKLNKTLKETDKAVEDLTHKYEDEIAIMKARGYSTEEVTQKEIEAIKAKHKAEWTYVTQAMSMYKMLTDEQKEQMNERIKKGGEYLREIEKLQIEEKANEIKLNKDAARLRLENMADGYARDKALLMDKYNDELAAAGNNSNLIGEIIKAQNKELTALNKKYHEDELKRLQELRDKEVELYLSMKIGKRVTSELNDEIINSAKLYMDLFAKIDWARRNNLQIPVTEEDIDLIKKTGKSIQDLEKDYEGIFGKTKAAGESFSEWWGGLDMGGKADFIGEYVGKAIDAFGQYSDIVEGQNQQELEGFKTTQDEKLRVLNERLRLGYITEEQYTAKKSDLELDYEKKKQELEKESFKKKKAMMIAEATMTAASATIHALDSKTTAEMVLKMAFIALTYGMQLAKIQAQTPGYAKGRKDGPATFAKVGEQGWEFTGDGTNIFKTPNSTTLTYLKPHQWVMPHNESVQLEKVLGTPTVNQIVTKNPQHQDKELVKAIDRLAKKPTAIVNMDAHGIRAALYDGANSMNFVNNHILFKN